MDDARIIELYFARDEAAIEQTRASYGHKLRAVALRILADAMDAQECENDTYLKTWTSIPPNRPVHFFAYIAKICRNAALGILEYRGAAKRSAQVVELTDEMQQCIPDSLAERAFEPEEIGSLLTATFYVNNILNYRPLDESESSTGTYSELGLPMFFGFDLKLTIR